MFSRWPVCVQMAALTAMLFLALSCTSPTKQGPARAYQKGNTGKHFIHSHYDNSENRLLEEYRRWRGTKHKMGGSDQRGVDCSGFVKAVYKSVYKIDLPRTTKGQLSRGTFVGRYELQAGDLVFFKPPDYPRHVGIYLSNNTFLHASKTKGVTISRIDPHYWGKYYWEARRIHPAQ